MSVRGRIRAPLKSLAARARPWVVRVLGDLGTSDPASEQEDGHFDFDPTRSLFDCSADEVERWNSEWLRYLGREWKFQLRHYTDLLGPDELPDDPFEIYDAKFGPDRLRCFVAGERIRGQRVMELGCGCGNLAKLLAQHSEYYLGVDYSPLALRIARLVSPANTAFIHVGDRSRLEAHFGTIDTVVSRYFWIHQNLPMARRNLDFLSHFVRPGGVVLLDLFEPQGVETHFKVFSAFEPLSKKYPSCKFAYNDAAVSALVDNSAFEVAETQHVEAHERRYVTLERI